MSIFDACFVASKRPPTSQIGFQKKRHGFCAVHVALVVLLPSLLPRLVSSTVSARCHEVQVMALYLVLKPDLPWVGVSHLATWSRFGFGVVRFGGGHGGSRVREVGRSSRKKAGSRAPENLTCSGS